MGKKFDFIQLSEARREFRDEIVDFIENQFVEKVVQKKAVQSWVEWQVVYQIEVFGLESSQIWGLDFAGQDAAIIKGRVGKIN